jgi:hypothetical protein
MVAQGSRLRLGLAAGRGYFYLGFVESIANLVIRYRYQISAN